jgi:catechol 2,3-dioxygenase-like lactoylglutathione lyase family enzyme
MPTRRKLPAPRSPRPQVHSIALVVSDRAKAKAWYTGKLGLDLVDSDDHWITVGRKGGGLIHLCRGLDYDPKAVLEPGNSGVMLRLGKGDFEAQCAALKARGVEFSQPPEKAAWGWYAGVRDPDGNEIWLAP